VLLAKSTRALFFIVTLVAIFANTPVTASETDTPSIVVTGEGHVDLAPDMAVLLLTVSREAKTAKAALDENSAAMSDVLTAMRALGIDKIDLQTSSFSVQPKYYYPAQGSSGNREAPKEVAYIVRNSLNVRVRNIDRVGDILDKSITLGVNEGGNISFSDNDPSSALSQARTLAVQDAISKAKTLARAAGVKLGNILKISERTVSQRPVPMSRATMSMADSSNGVPITGGENTYRVIVNVSFAIDQ